MKEKVVGNRVQLGSMFILKKKCRFFIQSSLNTIELMHLTAA